MSITKKQLELIQSFLSNALSGDDQIEFEKELENKSFRQELVLQAKLIDAYNLAHWNELKDYLNDSIPISETHKLTSVKRSYITIFLLGLILTMLVLSYYMFWKQTEPGSLVQLNNYKSLYPAEIVERGSEMNDPKEYQSAMAAYANSDYEKAYTLFNALQNQTPEIRLYKANALIADDKYAEALAILKTLQFKIKNNLSQNADWYTIVCYLGLNDKDAAMPLLDKLTSDKSHLFYKKGRELFEALSLE